MNDLDLHFTYCSKSQWMEIMPVPTCCKLHAHNYTCIPKILGRRGTLDPTGQLVSILTQKVFIVSMFDKLFDVMTNCLTLWQTCWRHDVFLTSCRTFWCYDELVDVMTNFLRSWRLFDVMTCFWRYGDLLASWRVFDVMANLFTSWRTFLRHDELVDVIKKKIYVMRCLWCYDNFFDVTTCVWRYVNFLTSWCTFDIFFMSWRVFDVITICFYVMMCFWCYHDVLTNLLTKLLTSWRTFWRHDELFDLVTCFWRHDVDVFVT